MRNGCNSTIRRVLQRLAVAGALFAPVALAQDSSGLVPFPVVTNTNVHDCPAFEDPLTGPAGGNVFLSGGDFINRGNTIYVTAVGNNCSNNLTISFKPAATAVNIELRTFQISVNDEILFEVWQPSGISSTQYTLPPNGTVMLSAEGQIQLVMLRSVRTGIPLNSWAFGVSSLAITQPPINNSFVQFDSANGQDDHMILISKAAWDIGYPSRFQLPPDGAGNPVIKIAGTLRDGFTGQPKSGAVHLRVNDPPDPAPYRGGDARPGDNDGGAASINGATTTSVQADSQGRFEAALVVNSRTAGDNYEVVGAADDQFTCGGTSCPRSPAFTLWKRVYVEEEQMFRRGSFLNDLARASLNEIRIEDPTPFQGLATGEMLELVHAESGRGEGFYRDFVAFNSLEQKTNGDWVITTAAATPVPRSYGAPPSPTPNPLLDVIRDGVGVVSAGTFKTNASYTETLFASMFVEMKPIASAVTEVPYVAELKNPINFFADRWLQQGVRITLLDSRPDANVFHRIAASQAPLVKKEGFCSGAQAGVTFVGRDENFSYIFDQRIRDLAAGVVADSIAGCPAVGGEYLNAPAFRINGEVTAHETVHFWVHTAREPDMDSEGHCVRNRYVDDTNCLMHRPYAGPELYDGQVLLHYDMNGAHSEYMWVRRDPDPVPQQ